MDKYEVLLYPKAFRDIEDIYAYIALEKLSPENVRDFVAWQPIATTN